MKNYCLYGAGKYISSFIKIFNYFGDNVLGIIDSDPQKTGKVICGVSVYLPVFLKETDCEIIISCMAIHEIRDNLRKMGVENREVPIQKYLENLATGREHLKQETTSGMKMYFDLYSGAKWGGAENWNYFVAEQVKKRYSDAEVAIISDEYKDKQQENIVPIIDISENDVFEKVKELISSDKKICFINSFYGSAFFAFLILKVLYPNSVYLVTVVHNDYKDLYTICEMFKDFIDKFVCVSSKIQNHLVEQCGVKNKDTVFFPQPMEIKKIKSSDYSGEAIRIGVATRLTKQQKRVDYLPQIITNLEERKIKYELLIAGDGDYYDMLKEFISVNNLSERVKLLGMIKHDDMWEYWNNIDVYLNFSDFEGSSLAMLEAMSCYCVPVVTDVSGTRDYIVNGENGLISGIGDIQSLCGNLEFLSQNRDLVLKMGTRAREAIIEKCNVDNYIQKFWGMLQEV